MKQLLTILLLTTFSSFAKDKDYQIGTYVKIEAVHDGTLTNTVHGDGTTMAGDVYRNYIGVYRIQVANGIWALQTARQTVDSMMRDWGTTPHHLKSEKHNPLDFLKYGDAVMFRIERHRKIGGTDNEVYIPFADNPKKEAKFYGWFTPKVIPQSQKSARPTDNVKAMYNSGRLSAEQQKQLCEGEKR
jgi:hypothetical protein